MVNVWILILLAHLMNAKADDIGALIEKMPSVNPTLARAGQKPLCPPAANTLSVYDRDNCPNSQGYKPKIYPTQNVPGASGKMLAVSVIPEADLPALFTQVKSLGAFWGNARLCIQRALIMGYCLQHAMNIQPTKIIATGTALTTKCGYSTGTIWPQHQAVSVLVKKKNGQVEPYVIDPSTMQAIAPLPEWKNCLLNVSDVTIGAPNAISVEEAKMDSPPAYNADKDALHDIDRAWKVEYRR